jgi:hypothetical protein
MYGMSLAGQQCAMKKKLDKSSSVDIDSLGEGA